jgi:hypothetical protein
MLIGELVPEALRFLRNNPASSARTAFDHVIVDEYQDLNRAEQELVDLLVGNGATAIVGDVDQSIYRFRHANPEGIEEFQQRHPGTHDETLDQCRRCPTRVVAVADHLIRHNHPDALVPRLQPQPGNPQGSVHIIQWSGIEEEAQGLAGFVRALVADRGYAPGDILILRDVCLDPFKERADIFEVRDCRQSNFAQDPALVASCRQQSIHKLCEAATFEVGKERSKIAVLLKQILGAWQHECTAACSTGGSSSSWNGIKPCVQPATWGR